jgi:excisionase family DNA binding protein
MVIFEANLINEVIMNGDETMDVCETATLLHAESETVLQFARRGELPGTRIGKSWVFLREDVIAFLKNQIAKDTEQRRRQTSLPDAVLAPVTRHRNRKQLPLLPTLPAK